MVLLSTETYEFKRFLQFLLQPGCRRNEALGVAWEDIELDKRQIVIRGQIGKMGKRRTIPINDPCMLSCLIGQNGGRDAYFRCVALVNKKQEFDMAEE